MSMEQTLHVLLPHRKGEALGLACNSKMTVRKLLPNTSAAKVLHINDCITAVNHLPVTSLDELTAAINAAPGPTVVLTLRRQRRSSSQTKELPRSDAYLDADEPGRLIVVFTWRRDGPRLGLAIKQLCTSIMVSRCTPHSLAAQLLMPGDVIIAVNTTPVTNRDETKALIVDKLATHGHCALLIERLSDNVPLAHSGTDAENMLRLSMDSPTTSDTATSRKTSLDVLPMIKKHARSPPGRVAGPKSILKKPSTSSIPTYLLNEPTTCSHKPLPCSITADTLDTPMHKKSVQIQQEHIEHLYYPKREHTEAIMNDSMPDGNHGMGLINSTLMKLRTPFTNNSS